MVCLFAHPASYGLISTFLYYDINLGLLVGKIIPNCLRKNASFNHENPPNKWAVCTRTGIVGKSASCVAQNLQSLTIAVKESHLLLNKMERFCTRRRRTQLPSGGPWCQPTPWASVSSSRRCQRQRRSSVKNQRFESKCSPTVYLVPSPKSRFCTIQNRARGLVRIKLRSHNSFLLNARKGRISLICLAKKCNQTS
jgi:hypothetical protein